jgi:hypothetical protein
MSGTHAGRAWRRAAALALAAGSAAGGLAVAQAAPAHAVQTIARCTFAQTDLSFAGSPARVIAHGECVSAFPPDQEGAALFVRLFRSGTLVFSGGNGVGIVTAIYTCQGSAVNDFTAVWSTGQTNEQSFACG